MNPPPSYDASAPDRVGFARALAVYLDRGVLIVLLLGFSAGLPLALAGSTLAIWMADKGVSLAAIGIHSLSMRPASIGPVKHLLLRTDLAELKQVIHDAGNEGRQSARNAIKDYLSQNK